MMVAEAVASVGSFSTVIGDLLELAGSTIQWCLTTFPINVSIGAGFLGLAIGVAKKSKRLAH